MSGTPLADVQEIEKASKRSSEITKRLLQYAQSRALWPCRFNPSTLIEEILAELRSVAGDNIEVTTSSSSEIPSVELDEGIFKETILALVRNAREAMPAGGKLRISLHEEKLDSLRAEQLTLKPGTFVSLSVADTGAGMDEETQRHIFEPFFTTKGLQKARVLAWQAHLASFGRAAEQSHSTARHSAARHLSCIFQYLLPELHYW
jgi:signal transduction histidine kinase